MASEKMGDGPALAGGASMFGRAIAGAGDEGQNRRRRPAPSDATDPLADILSKLGIDDGSGSTIVSKENEDSVIAVMVDVLQIPPDQARFFLESANSDVSVAVNLHFELSAGAADPQLSEGSKRFRHDPSASAAGFGGGGFAFPSAGRHRWASREVDIVGLPLGWRAFVGATTGQVRFRHVESGAEQDEVPPGFADLPHRPAAPNHHHAAAAAAEANACTRMASGDDDDDDDDGRRGDDENEMASGGYGGDGEGGEGEGGDDDDDDDGDMPPLMSADGTLEPDPGVGPTGAAAAWANPSPPPLGGTPTRHQPDPFRPTATAGGGAPFDFSPRSAIAFGSTTAAAGPAGAAVGAAAPFAFGAGSSPSQPSLNLGASPFATASPSPPGSLPPSFLSSSSSPSAAFASSLNEVSAPPPPVVTGFEVSGGGGGGASVFPGFHAQGTAAAAAVSAAAQPKGVTTAAAAGGGSSSGATPGGAHGFPPTESSTFEGPRIEEANSSFDDEL